MLAATLVACASFLLGRTVARAPRAAPDRTGRTTASGRSRRQQHGLCDQPTRKHRCGPSKPCQVLAARCLSQMPRTAVALTRRASPAPRVHEACTDHCFARIAHAFHPASFRCSGVVMRSPRRCIGTAVYRCSTGTVLASPRPMCSAWFGCEAVARADVPPDAQKSLGLPSISMPLPSTSPFLTSVIEGPFSRTSQHSSSPSP